MDVYTSLLETKSTNMLMMLLKQRLESSVGVQEEMNLYTTPYSHKRKISNLSQENPEAMLGPSEIVDKNSKDIINFDYLMTARQLLDILRENPSDLDKFARKSRI